jgi:hypothetical protein
MRRALASLSLIAFLSLIAVAACSDRTPTGPAFSSSSPRAASSASSASVSSRAPRVVRARAGSDPALQGVWGGEHIGLTITSGGAGVEYDCAAGSIDQAFQPDASGRFDFGGTWWFTPPVVFEDWQPDKKPARYSGVVQGKTMTLTLTRMDDGTTVHFTLVQNTIPRILRCL